jgi:Uma2 family endonuclease
VSPSTSARDRGIKQRLYGKYAVRFSWIVDAERRTIQAYGLDNDSYTPVATFDASAARPLPPLPDLTLDPAIVWS